MLLSGQRGECTTAITKRNMSEQQELDKLRILFNAVQKLDEEELES